MSQAEASFSFEQDTLKGDEEQITGSSSSTPLDRLSANGKHASLVIQCGLLHSVIVREAVDRLLNLGPEALPAEGALWIAPSFGWLEPRISVGRKGRGPRGARLRFPVRLQWPQVVNIVPASATRRPVSIGWTTTSMGHSGTGTTFLSLTRWATEWESRENDAGIPIQATGPVLTRAELTDLLTAIHDESKHAEWELIMSFERLVATALARAHAGLSEDVARYLGSPIRPLLDSTKLEKVRDEMLFGVDGHPGKIRSMINRMIDPQSLNKVDPQRYAMKAIERDAAEAIRQEIGDPRIGSQVRRVHRELGNPDIDVLLSEFNKMYPSASLSYQRANDALSVEPDPMATWFSMHPGDED